MYAGIYVSAASTLFFPQNMMFRNGSICAMKSVPGRAKQNNGLSFLSRNGDIIMKTVSFRITD